MVAPSSRAEVADQIPHTRFGEASPNLLPAPEFTPSPAIKLNRRVSLRHHLRPLMSSYSGRGPRASGIQMDFAASRIDFAGAKNDNRKPQQGADAGFEFEAGMGSDLALVDGNSSAPIYHRSSRFRESLATPRRPPLDLQGGDQATLRPCVRSATSPLFLR
jgi:hypothetical protein